MTDKEQKRHWTLAVDIERSGAFGTNDTVAMGAAVRDENLAETHRWVFNAYVAGDCEMEERCKVEFWDTHPGQLEACAYKGVAKSKDEREKEMIEGFHAFRITVEELAKEKGAELDFVSDNKVYDFGFINQLYFEHMRDTLPIPYHASDPEYGSAWETHSMQRGFLLAVDTEFALANGWGYAKRIEELYDVPPDKVEHDHRPDNDASTIAKENAVLLGIARGTIKRKSTARGCRAKKRDLKKV